MPETNRRDFIKNTAAAGTAAAVMIGPKTWAQANDKVRVAVIGLFGRGGSHIDAYKKREGVELAALCDVDEKVLNSKGSALEKETGKKPKLYKDLRQVFEDKDIDAVTIATPNHWHALAGIWACQAGKDVYVEKPCSHNVWEGRQLVKAARKYNRIVQMGNQSRSSEALKESVQKLKEGAIGEVYMARGLCFKRRGSIGKQAPTNPPDGFDYNLWTGPGELQPYTRNRHPYKWHWFWNTGNGDIGNQGVHEMDRARWGLGVDMPSEVMAMGSKFMFDDDQETPNTMVATFKFPGVNKMLVFEVRHWITNDEAGIAQGDDGKLDPNTVGVVFYGSEGYLVQPDYGSYLLYDKNRQLVNKVKKGGDHFGNFIAAVRSRKIEDNPAEIEGGHVSSALCHLANISHRVGRALKFDPATETITGDEEASKLLTRQYREGFVVPQEV